MSNYSERQRIHWAGEDYDRSHDTQTDDIYETDDTIMIPKKDECQSVCDIYEELDFITAEKNMSKCEVQEEQKKQEEQFNSLICKHIPNPYLNKYIHVLLRTNPIVIQDELSLYIYNKSLSTFIYCSRFSTSSLCLVYVNDNGIWHMFNNGDHSNNYNGFIADAFPGIPKKVIDKYEFEENKNLK